MTSNEEGIARVTFRVRCDSLGHGESVYLAREDDSSRVSHLLTHCFCCFNCNSFDHSITGPIAREIHLYIPSSNHISLVLTDSLFFVDASQIPLYTTSKTYPNHTTRTPLSIVISKGSSLRYRYAIYRCGEFNRWESESLRDLPLSFVAGELYTVNDILGEKESEVDHIRVKKTFSSVATLARSNANSSASLGLGNAEVGGSKKKVGFAPVPPAPRLSSPPKQAVHLTSSDGLIVVSAFLPVHLTRSDEGEWTADWDYEALLSMQTHLRVTRVGTVKWRGWHGNVGGGKSDESGVPVDERHKVEAVLRPFNCVPVWVPTTIFGEM